MVEVAEATRIVVEHHEGLIQAILRYYAWLFWTSGYAGWLIAVALFRHDGADEYQRRPFMNKREVELERRHRMISLVRLFVSK